MAIELLEQAAGWIDEESIQTVRNTVDVRRLLADRIVDGREFDGGRYIRARCIGPEHSDSSPSMLVFHDGCYCLSCGYRADAISLYQQFNEVSFRAAVEALLAPPAEWVLLDGNTQPRELRQLNPALAARYHLNLAANLEALLGLEQFGFSRKAIKHFQLGYAKVPVHLEQTEQPSWQWRYSVPVWEHLKLVQVLYRKAHEEDPGEKILMEAGAGSHLFNTQAINNELLIVNEGWGDTVALYDWSLPAVTSTNGAGHWREDWSEQVRRVKRLYVVGDSDAAGQKLVYRIQQEVPWVRPITLPELPNTKDVRDLKRQGWSRDQFLGLIKAADRAALWRKTSLRTK